MKTLYLVRHAKSSWDYPELKDFDRPLNSRGTKNAPEMGRYLKDRGILPDLMLSSPANRAISTAQFISTEIGYVREIVTDKQIYDASGRILLSILRDQSSLLGTVMMFGHNPAFTDFANSLSNSQIDNIPTCGVCQIDFPINKWSNVDFGSGEMIFFQYPKGLS